MLTLAFGPVASREAMAIPEALVAKAASHLDLFDKKADLLRAAAGFMIASKA